MNHKVFLILYHLVPKVTNSYGNHFFKIRPPPFKIRRNPYHMGDIIWPICIPLYACDSKKDENELWTCPFCNNKSITRNNYIRHLSVHKGDPIKPWESVKVKGHQSANVENWESPKQAESPVFINQTPTVGRSGSVLQVTNRNVINPTYVS